MSSHSFHDIFAALRRANPRNDPEFGRDVHDSVALKTRIMAMDPEPHPAAVRPSRATGRTRVTRRLVGLSAAGAILVIAAGAAVLLTTGASRGGSVDNAYAAVKQAVVNTSAAAESGTVTTKIAGESLPKIMGASLMLSTVTWNGDDVSIVTPAVKTSNAQVPKSNPAEYRYVGGRLYYTPGNGKWYHYDDLGDSSTELTAIGKMAANWGVVSRNRLTRPDLLKIMQNVADLEPTTNADGSTTYNGNATGKSIMNLPAGVVGLPQTAYPIVKVADLNAPIAVSITVGANGLISSVYIAYPSGGDEWTCSVTYSKIGSTPPIAAPAPDKVIESGPPQD